MQSGKSIRPPPAQPSEEKRKVIIELRPTRALMTAAARGGASASYGRKQPFDVAALFPDIDIDSSFPPTRVPAEQDARTPDHDAARSQAPKPKISEAETRATNYIIRAEVAEDQLPKLRARPEVAGVFSDPQIHPFANCLPFAKGTHLDVERLLCVPKLKAHGLDGSDVLVAVVDSGINLDYLNAHGKGPNFDRSRSWVPDASQIPGQFPVAHGTMCAFDVCIAAPRCTLLDIAVLKSSAEGLSGLLSDAVRAYDHLFSVMAAPLRVGEMRSMVVTNSWGMPNTDLDLPVGDPGNYSDNLNHPFNRSVTALEGAGADILFAAGNCGEECPSDRCRKQTSKTIYGANSHPDALCVAGVDITKTRMGYSSQGPGRLSYRKPDVCGYTHFTGSEVTKIDTGTSAACPVVAGLVAAFRTRWQYDVNEPETHPVAVRHYVTSTAGHGRSLAYDLNRGRGVVRGCQLVDSLYFDESPPPRLSPSFLDEFCRRYPELCPRARSAGGPTGPASQSELFQLLRQIVEAADQGRELSLAELEPILATYLMGRIQGWQHAPVASTAGCACGPESK